MWPCGLANVTTPVGNSSNMPINTGSRIVPKTAEIDISSRSGPYGTHDTLRNGFYSAAHQLAPKHALQQSLASIEQVEMDRKMFIATSTLGYHIPLRINLEKDIAKSVKPQLDLSAHLFISLEWRPWWLEIEKINWLNCFRNR